MSQVFRLDRRAVGKISLLTAVFYFSAYFYRFLRWATRTILC